MFNRKHTVSTLYISHSPVGGTFEISASVASEEQKEFQLFIIICQTLAFNVSQNQLKAFLRDVQ